MNISLIFILSLFGLSNSFKHIKPQQCHKSSKLFTKKYINSINGFSFNDEFKLNFSDKRKYDLASKTKRMLEISKKIHDLEKNNTIIVLNNRPSQANLNITYPNMYDIDDEDEDEFDKNGEFEKLVKKFQI